MLRKCRDMKSWQADASLKRLEQSMLKGANEPLNLVLYKVRANGNHKSQFMCGLIGNQKLTTASMAW